MTKIDNNKTYIKYAQDIVSGNIAAGSYIVKACKRFISWYDRDDIYFNYDVVDKKIRLISKFKLQEGPQFELLPFQQWIFANIYGWYYTDYPDERVISNALILTARKNGKSVLGAAIALASAIGDGVKSPEIAFIANSSKQAGMLFKYCRRLIKSIDPNEKLFHYTRNLITIPDLDGTIDVLASDTSRLDGRSDSCFIQDEAHAAKSSEIWDVLKTGQGARKNPLAVSITTAGFLIGEEYPLYAMCSHCKDMLDKKLDDDTFFAALYQMDEDDDWKDEKNWIKANPALGHTLQMKYLREQAQTAEQQPSREVSIKTKNFNIWCQGANTWLRDEDIKACMQNVDLQKLVGHQCYAGVDLSAVSDLTAWSVMFPPDTSRDYYPDKFIFKSLCYLPEETIETSPNRDQYKTFIRNKDLIKTPGNVVDYDIILEDQQSVDQAMVVHTWAYDSYNATQWALNAQAKGMNLVPFSQSLSTFNRPTKEFERLLKQGKIIIDSSLLTLWCFRNVELKFDWNDNVKPVKANLDLQNKIDPVISMLEALGAYLADTDAADPD